MNAILNSQKVNEDYAYNTHSHSNTEPVNAPSESIIENDSSQNKIRAFDAQAPLILPNHIMHHHVKAGLNPLVDAAGYLFSILGKLKQLKTYRQLKKLQTELLQEIHHLHATIKNQGYSTEYAAVCQYIVCATIDDILSSTAWGGNNQWDAYSLLSTLNQDTQHQDKFFSIMERTIKEPLLYIDLMELMYLCLSMGYKGQYRNTEHSQLQLEQITNNLYKHIRTYRGHFSKTLSPTPLKTHKAQPSSSSPQHSLIFIFIVTACIIMAIFVSLGYLMDVISNEAYSIIAPAKNSTVYQAKE